jgi:hypothetical protein
MPMTAPLDKEQQRSLNDLLADGVAQKNKARVEACLHRGGQADCVVTTRTGQGFVRKKPLAHHAYENYQPDVMETLVRHGMPLEAADGDGNTVLARAVQDRKEDVVEKLIELGASPLAAPNNAGKTILDMARVSSESVRFDTIQHRRTEKIIDLLLAALPVVRQDFNEAAKAAGGPPPPGTTDDVVVRKPITITHKPPQKSGGRDQGGFTL